MSSARCVNCGKMLCKAEDDVALEVSPQAAQADKNHVAFFIKCPRCGKMNTVNFIKNR